MFHKLRIQLIWTTMSLVTAVLVISFAAIYLSAANTFRRELEPPPAGPMAARFERLDQDVVFLINDQRQQFADRSLRELLITLVVAGVIMLAVVYLICRRLTDRAVGAIEDTYEKQRQFIADASHELKTPIAVIGTNADAAMSDNKKPSKWLTNIRKESDKMGRLVQDLLLLAKLDSDSTPNQPTQFDVATLIDEVSNDFKSAIVKKKVHFIQKTSKSAEISGNPDKTKQLFAILVDNAIKYTEPGGDITISTKFAKSKILIDIANTHPYVPEEELRRFFDRFYQSDTSHRSGGHGLGLAIAKDIATQLNADLYVTSTKNQIVFTVELSKYPN